ncbi:M23 family metallopeptidase [Paraburkholderia aspalathi]|nr:M23 family metallopeptidase [Paraburkholderia aspalathi]MBK3780343.1 M23 family metallopeptidase [Paraburkholderia aspalathi]
MTWLSPIPFELVPTADSESFASMGANQTGLPLAPHPGAFGVRRKHHTHEGVDLYVPEGTPVRAVDDGEVVAVKPFTGPAAGPGLAHWLDTQAVFVEGLSGVVVYGELVPCVVAGTRVAAGTLLGHATTVLAKDKGRPRCMLHLELHSPGSRVAPEWLVHDERPAELLDPTPYLLAAGPASGIKG